MSLDYIRKSYGVPAKRGVRVQYLASDGELVEGRITGSSGARLRVRLDGNKQSFIFHPTFNLAYRQKGKWLDATPTTVDGGTVARKAQTPKRKED